MLTRNQLEAFHSELVRMMKRLGADLGGLRDEALQATGGEASGGLSNVPLHMGDLGSRQAEENLTITLVGTEEQLLEDIDAALTRIEQGTYGACEECQAEIPLERLEALPYTRYCVKCAQDMENETF